MFRGRVRSYSSSFRQTARPPHGFRVEFGGVPESSQDAGMRHEPIVVGQHVVMTHRIRILAVVFAAVVGLLLPTAGYAGPVWLVYHGDSARTGNDRTERSLLPSRLAWTERLDAAVYAQPLVAAGRVFAVTENDTVY